MLKIKWIYALALLAGIALLVLPWVFPVCSIAGRNMPMRCFFAYQAEFLLALFTVIIAVSLFFTKEKETKQLTGFFLVVAAVLIFIIPAQWVIGICGHGDSPCHVTTAWARGLSLVLGLAGLAITWKFRENTGKE
ncbi:hypothetical protein P22_3202 [Propionispora sp. 2/2-37]|uniref:DUF4418 family protein n=1 Tax=Propionispora sp. 2/2-37 TaxID=1677858 RepID=UPI0006BB6C2B|nr:DUF4418 family protein [Propionispora sp. 2/2-37]CUH97076.1 hypothetical protein P22_3202 [Propionispora sp. 2/2-37]